MAPERCEVTFYTHSLKANLHNQLMRTQAVRCALSYSPFSKIEQCHCDFCSVAAVLVGLGLAWLGWVGLGLVRLERTVLVPSNWTVAALHES